MIDRKIESLVGHVLLHKVSPGGGSSGHPSLDLPHLEKILQDSTTEEVYALFVTVAQNAQTEAQEDMRRGQMWLARDLEKINETLDSLSLHHFIEKYKARPHEELERLRSLEDVAARHVEDFGSRLPSGRMSYEDMAVAVRATVLAALEEVTRAQP